MKLMGKNPTGARLEKLRQSPNFRDGAFRNLTPTTEALQGASMFEVLSEFASTRAQVKPPHPIEAVKTDLKNLDSTHPAVVWFGHSSYLIAYRGKNILVDPIFSGHIDPVSFFAKAFRGTSIYAPPDMPEIDILVITHDHYDHLDFKTLRALRPKVKRIVTSLGVGSHLEYWGFAPEIITELDWWESKELEAGIKFTGTPARHFSGRGVKRGQTLWSSFVMDLYDQKIFLGGDSGYGDHFKTIGKKFGPFDLAVMECGQYGKNWPMIHAFPEETAQASRDLGAKVMLPVHWGKFSLALHKWNDSIERVVKAAAELEQPLVTPRIGEAFWLGRELPTARWW